MPLYELLLEINEPTEAALEMAEDEFELVYAQHGAFHRLTVWVEAASPLKAAKSVVASLKRADIRTVRLLEDLVTRQDIADRLDTSRQAVGNWIRGSRRGSDFPNPCHLVSGGVWLWGEVNAWCRNNGMSADEVEHPARCDYGIINSWLFHELSSVPDISFDKRWHTSYESHVIAEPRKIVEDRRWEMVMPLEALSR